jgi:transposase-like protein
MRLRLLVPQVKPQPANRPKACRTSDSPLLQRHQAVSKKVSDTQVRETQAVRYRCTACGRTFRYYPEGVSRYRQSQRVMGLAVLFWTLGLSEWATSHVLHALDAGIHRSSVHRLSEGAPSMQQLTVSRWGGLLVARPAPPQTAAHSRGIGWSARTRKEALLIQLAFEDFDG